MDDRKSSAELVAETLIAYQSGDQDTLRRLMHPEGEIYGVPGLINAGTYRGYEGFRKWITQWEEAWDEITYELGDFVEIDESVIVAPVHIVGRGATSGVEIDSTFGWVYQWEDGLLRRYQVYTNVEDALDAARKIAAEAS
ncbi:MAG TPA: nuclear transport factor 2 family protein [Solirubrobacterales bacterium]|nr:nuclear transport factor 2 family protein [Solirubrobacterales bacterium]